MSEPLQVPGPQELGRFLAGEASPAEEAEVRRWLAARVDQQVDVEAALASVKARASGEVARVKAFTPRFLALAAAAVVLMVVGAIVARRGPTTEPLRLATTAGQRDSLVLPDGSRIVLGPSTSVVVRDRDVELRGEAYFDVVHSAPRPLTVHALGAVIRDIGTQFAVSGDSGAPLRVVVREGIVEVTHANDSVTLHRGDVAVVDSGGRVEAQRGAATPDDLAWLNGTLAFRNASVAEEAADLRRWYGVQVRVTDSVLLQRHFTGQFAGEPVDRVIEVIALALGARHERRGDTVIVRPASPGR